jgi:hypothetical protein
MKKIIVITLLSQLSFSVMSHTDVNSHLIEIPNTEELKHSLPVISEENSIQHELYACTMNKKLQIYHNNEYSFSIKKKLYSEAFCDCIFLSTIKNKADYCSVINN